ncbi:MAG: YfhO family protein [Candidatus Levybacteria bacterium]|nr:YfhO family protein [Candidatus Levybacteria bacterium]
MKKIFPFVFIVFLVIIFFWQFLLKGLLPIPGDAIIGLYHPFRDLYAKDYPNGIPFKNFLITDPVRQQYPWKKLVIDLEKKRELPLWNPYNFAGTPLLGNFQSASFYFLNILFFIMPFSTAWSLIIFLSPLLAGIFLFLYLDNLKLKEWASILGAIVFAFSGFSIAWMEWGTILHVGLWLPLILLSIDKVFFNSLSSINSKFKIKKFIWSFIFVFSLTSSFFAGHLQTFFYLFLFSTVYTAARWIQFGRQKQILTMFTVLNSLFVILTVAQWLPTLQFILLSARNADMVGFNTPGWFIPWQNLIQFIAPDFFGNPTTLNYWGVWNYAEFVGYIGILPLVMAIFALFFRRDKKTFFYGMIFFISLIFSLPTIFAKLPYLMNIPFLSTAQPTRLLFIADFLLTVLVAFGFDYVIRYKKREIVYPLIFIILILLILWAFVIFGNGITKIVSAENMLVVRRNLVFPTLILIISAFLLLVSIRTSKIHKSFTVIIYAIIVTVTVFDLFRFGWKFIPFTDKNYLFPSTSTISFLQKNLGEFRIMSTDSRILPPNFSSIYRLKSIDGYDPLYLLRYGELIAASERNSPNIDPPFGFNRIITPQRYDFSRGRNENIRK